MTSARQFTQYFLPRSAMLPGSCFLLSEAELHACALRAAPRELLNINELRARAPVIGCLISRTTNVTFNVTGFYATGF